MMGARQDTTFGSLKKYRDSTDMIYLMLNHMRSESRTQTDLMFEARMSYTQVKQYKKLLLEKGLVELSKDKHRNTTESYVVTKKGLDVIHVIETLKEMLK